MGKYRPWSAALVALCLGVLLSMGGLYGQDGTIVGDVDDSAESCKSLGGSGHAVQFTRPADAKFVQAVEVFCARYGPLQPPDRDFHIYVLNDKGQALADVAIAYKEVKRGGTDKLRWQKFETPAVEVTEKFSVALAFEPDQHNGVYVGYDESVDESHSSQGLHDDGFEPVDGKWDWMVRATMVETPAEGVKVMRLADWKPLAAAGAPEGSIELKWDNGESEGQQSYGGSGPGIVFALKELVPDTMANKPLAVHGLRVYGSRYGGGFDPKTTTVKVSFVDSKAQAYDEREIPYARFSHKPKWVEVVFDQPVPIKSQQEGVLGIGLDPEAQRTKGIFFHYNKDPKQSHSSKGTVGRGFTATPDREWMIRAWVGPVGG